MIAALSAFLLAATSVSPDSPDDYAFIEPSGFDVSGTILDGDTIRGEDVSFLREAYAERRLAVGSGDIPGAKELMDERIVSFESVLSNARWIFGRSETPRYVKNDTTETSSTIVLSGDASDSDILAAVFGRNDFGVTMDELSVTNCATGDPLTAVGARSGLVEGLSRLKKVAFFCDVICYADDAMKYEGSTAYNGDPGSKDFEDGSFVPSEMPENPDPQEWNYGDEYGAANPSYEVSVSSSRGYEFGWTAEWVDGNLVWNDDSVQSKPRDYFTTAGIVKSDPVGDVGGYFHSAAAKLSDEVTAKAFAVCSYTHTKTVSGVRSFVADADVVIPVSSSASDKSGTSHGNIYPPKIVASISASSLFGTAKTATGDSTVSPASVQALVPDVSSNPVPPRIGDFPEYAGETRLTSSSGSASETAKLIVRRLLIVAAYKHHARTL